MKNLFAQRIFTVCACIVAIVGSAGLAPDVNAAPPTAIAYAHVLGNGKLDAANSKNVVALGRGNGLYCFKLTFKPKSAIATLANDPTAPNQGIGFIKVALPPTPTFTCPTIPKPDAVVETGTETSVNSGKSDGGYAFYVYWTR
ncbi:MAG TPA: hypothetical protein VI685_02775 [Candidatus Angelobacter sp.]